MRCRTVSNLVEPNGGYSSLALTQAQSSSATLRPIGGPTHRISAAWHPADALRGGPPKSSRPTGSGRSGRPMPRCPRPAGREGAGREIGHRLDLAQGHPRPRPGPRVARSVRTGPACGVRKPPDRPRSDDISSSGATTCGLMIDRLVGTATPGPGTGAPNRLGRKRRSAPARRVHRRRNNRLPARPELVAGRQGCRRGLQDRLHATSAGAQTRKAVVPYGVGPGPTAGEARRRSQVGEAGHDDLAV
jgi:hypothetical protein